MPEYRSTLNQTTIDEETGVLMLRCRKELVLDDGKVVELGWHRFAIEPGQDVDETLTAVNAHLDSDQIEGGPITADGVATVRKRVLDEHTQERIDARKRFVEQGDTAQPVRPRR